MLNVCAFVGRITADPVIRKTNDGKSVLDFTIAVERDFKNGGNKETDFIRCQAWRSTADFLSSYAKKGDLLSVSGRLQIYSYTDKYGAKKSLFQIVCESAYICRRAEKDHVQTGNDYAGYPAFGTPDIPQFGDDFPQY